MSLTVSKTQKDTIDKMVDDATELQNQGRWDEANTMLAEADNLLDRWAVEITEIPICGCTNTQLERSGCKCGQS